MGYKREKVPVPAETGTDTIKKAPSDNIVTKDTGKVNFEDTKSRTAGQQRLAGRKRNFATVIYPDSAPEDWQDRLTDAHVAALISPLHDKDINPDGEIKKPHRHVLLMFDSPKDFETQVKPIFDAIGGVGREVVNSMRGYARYLCHLDNPDKAQYKTADIIQLGGADYSAVVHLPTDDSKMLIELFAYIKTHQIYSFAELLDVCAVNNIDWFNMITMSRAYIVDKYIKSLAWEVDARYERQSEHLCKTDPETGEVLEEGRNDMMK